MNVNVFGLVSVDILEFQNHTSYLGGGALATAWIASLWEVPSNLYSISCKNYYNEIIDKNILWNKEFFSHTVLSKNKKMAQFEISEQNGDYAYKIQGIDNTQEELKQFLEMTLKGQYIKLPANNFRNLEKMMTSASINPQGMYNLIDLTQKIHTEGFIFLNNKELLMNSKLYFSSALVYIEKIQQSFVVTLGHKGAVCYSANEKKWYYCPAIRSTQCINTLGCGDAFAGGFLAAVAKKYSIDKCMVFGTISAYLVTCSPSNMITVWPDTILADNILNKLLMEIRHFDNADELIMYLKLNKNEAVTEKMFPDISSKFNWEITEMEGG